MRTSDLPQRISRRLLQDIATGGIQAGQHLGAQQLADRYGVSRTPVREAMNLLETKGFLVREENRGYFVAEPDRDALSQLLDEQPASLNDEYHKLAEHWLTGQLPEDVTEQFLRQHYGWSKARANEILVRATREGWVERKEGYGWRFLPVANTPEAFDEIYRFRMAIEPAAMLEPSFALDRKILAEQRRIQEGMLEMDFSSVPAESLLENGALFHEEIIKLSGNPYFLMALQRVNRMRRLMEYRAEVNHERLVEQCSEHLEILDMLEAGDNLDASHRMRQHLSGALKRKSPLTWTWAADARKAGDA
ncbi:GntR family transcriptional regulator [Roseobacter sinensis]|uniref:GntR family transcriptional regulator n=1 Tax=Roseobacter sinensis TaxID=2931391 RepID=A0ABT3BGR2_9RHOB|nr:GntR family transcriptional regulator [Roseobacter sp. WL0113]MCV3272761.1 GntR family transcriptional regulator [Roseobacter sp. WL0113]